LNKFANHGRREKRIVSNGFGHSTTGTSLAQHLSWFLAGFIAIKGLIDLL
jgi:hypothetical protein